MRAAGREAANLSIALNCGEEDTSKPQIEPNPGLIQQSPAKIKPRKSLDFLRRIEPYQGITPTPRAFFYFCAASRLEGGHGAASALPVRMGFMCRFLGLHFEFLLAFSSEVKGWRRFHDRGRLGAVLSDLAAAEPDEREKGTRRPRIPGACPGRDLRKKTGRSIRCPARIRPLKRARTGFEPNGQADGRQPFMPASVSQPLPFDASLPFRPCEANAAAFRRAC